MLELGTVVGSHSASFILRVVVALQVVCRTRRAAPARRAVRDSRGGRAEQKHDGQGEV